VDNFGKYSEENEFKNKREPEEVGLKKGKKASFFKRVAGVVSDSVGLGKIEGDNDTVEEFISNKFKSSKKIRKNNMVKGRARG
jgi:hypothetical protein